jgi:hypothetical protein
MMTSSQLLLFAANFQEEFLTPFLPPGDWVERCGFPAWRRVSKNALAVNFDLPFTPGHGRQWVIPCFSSSTSCSYAYRFTARAELPDGSRTPWRSLRPIGGYPDRGNPPGAGIEVGPVFNTAIGAFFIKQDVHHLQVRLRVSTSDAGAITEAPSLISISMSSNARHQAPTVVANFPPVDIPIPARSQTVELEPLRDRICAPTSVSMVMEHFGVSAKTAAVAAQAYHAATDRYGVWQENIRAASRWGFLGYTWRFPSWSAAQALIRQGTPIIASLKYEAGHLENAPLEQTDGHLVTVRGFDDATVKVNDPAGEGCANVFREYRRDQFEAAWIKPGGVGLVLFPKPSLSAPIENSIPALR